jgi:hypothetical protein
VGVLQVESWLGQLEATQERQGEEGASGEGPPQISDTSDSTSTHNCLHGTSQQLTSVFQRFCSSSEQNGYASSGFDTFWAHVRQQPVGEQLAGAQFVISVAHSIPWQVLPLNSVLLHDGGMPQNEPWG